MPKVAGESNGATDIPRPVYLVTNDGDAVGSHAGASFVPKPLTLDGAGNVNNANVNGTEAKHFFYAPPDGFVFIVRSITMCVADDLIGTHATFGGRSALTNGCSFLKAAITTHAEITPLIFNKLKTNADLASMSDDYSMATNQVLSHLGVAHWEYPDGAFTLTSDEEIYLRVADDLTSLVTFTVTAHGYLLPE